MTPAELALPWSAFALEGYAPWRLVVSRGGRQTTLSSEEVLDLCAAVELERVHARSVGALFERRRRSRRRWTWELLAGGAEGLTRASAPGEVSLAEVLRRLEIELVRSEVKVESTEEKAA